MQILLIKWKENLVQPTLPLDITEIYLLFISYTRKAEDT